MGWHCEQTPVGRSSSFTMNSVYPPCCFLSLVVGADSWLKGESGILALADGRGRDVQGKPETESCEVSDLRDPEDPVKIPQRDSPPGDTVPSAPLFWLSLLEVCCRPPWVAHALCGPLALP